MKKFIVYIFAIVALVSCGTQKAAVSSTTNNLPKAVDNAAQKKLAYVKKVNTNAVSVQNICSKIDFSLVAGDKDITVDGKLQMRRDQVIRITITPFGLMEIGRLEFAPDYVLLVDRVNKQYVRATYNDLDFLKANGLDFFSLQALFWNQLFVPGTKTLNDASMKQYDVNLSAGDYHNITLKSGQLNYTWSTTNKDQHITSTRVQYATGTSNASTASWTYDDFKTLGNKQFPAIQKIAFHSKAISSSATATINLSKINTDADWDIKTTVSDSYKQVSAEDILKMLMSM